jgi:hypothetical protein
MSQFITLGTAVDMTTLYRQEKEAVLTENKRNQNILPVAETFDRAVIDSLLATDGCESIRIYYGMDTNLKVHAIMVPVDSSNEDILPEESPEPAIETGIVEQGYRCPEDCPPPSPLNS